MPMSRTKDNHEDRESWPAQQAQPNVFAALPFSYALFVCFMVPAHLPCFTYLAYAVGR